MLNLFIEGLNRNPYTFRGGLLWNHSVRSLHQTAVSPKNPEISIDTDFSGVSKPYFFVPTSLISSIQFSTESFASVQQDTVENFSNFILALTPHGPKKTKIAS